MVMSSEQDGMFSWTICTKNLQAELMEQESRRRASGEA